MFFEQKSACTILFRVLEYDLLMGANLFLIGYDTEWSQDDSCQIRTISIMK